MGSSPWNIGSFLLSAWAGFSAVTLPVSLTNTNSPGKSPTIGHARRPFGSRNLGADVRSMGAVPDAAVERIGDRLFLVPCF